ncbi:S66 family peptidase [Ornithinimicrobium pratense]|uniref:LD-carboxypeptidase n=1 Tax=Ornithinimicrobium pratense TaxID=2593973 RepID=A0A5J6V4X9_9MICO|nr:S66 peptidase family protein [Ornithinimicrobium pratense]QFG68647.1 LD-carboxypeptidase [Ornithinimicrobium pratense]
MRLRFPAPLRPGDLVGVTSPSSGVQTELRPRLDVAVRTVRQRGFEVEVGRCMDGSSHISAPAADRAAELERMLLDPRVRAVVPPWGGETAIDLIRLLDWDRLAQAEPTWMVGFSDIATLITPLTLLTGWASVHGNNLMDTPYRAPEGLVDWLDIVTLAPGATFTQTSPRAWREGFVDYAEHPGVDAYELGRSGSWRRLDTGGDDVAGGAGEEVEVTGRLVGGCVETLAHLAGTRYLDTSPLAGRGEGLIVYVEVSGAGALDVCRHLHGMRLAGFFTRADAVLVGRTAAPDAPTLTQDEAVLDALGDLGVPILADVECGHVAPHLPLVNGALATVRHTPEASTITQTLA